MTSLKSIKNTIKKLYLTNPNIHINVSMTSPKICLQNEPAVIKGVYPHIFQIEEAGSGFPQRRTLTYTDVFTKQIEIVECPLD